MYISAVRPNNLNYPSSNARKSEVNFEGKKLARIASYALPIPLLKIKKFSIDEYNRLNAIDKMLLRLQYKCLIPPFNHDFYKNTEMIHEHVSDFMKEGLDKKYGEGNYVVISIGRSLSSISKVLGYKIGEENVKNIPFSNSARFRKPESVDVLDESAIGKFKEYLSSIGLSEDKIKNSGKSYILTDFVATGSSLQGARNLFKSDKMFGKNSKIFSEDINNFIPSKNWNFRLTLREHLLESRFKPYSFVKKCERIEDTKKSEYNPGKASTEGKLVWFKLLDNYMRGVKTDPLELNTILSYY